MHIKALCEPSVICQSPGCEETATVLVVCTVIQRTEAKQLLVACCERHRGEVIAAVRLRYDVQPLSAAAASN